MLTEKSRTKITTSWIIINIKFKSRQKLLFTFRSYVRHYALDKSMVGGIKEHEVGFGDFGNVHNIYLGAS